MLHFQDCYSNLKKKYSVRIRMILEKMCTWYLHTSFIRIRIDYRVIVILLTLYHLNVLVILFLYLVSYDIQRYRHFLNEEKLRNLIFPVPSRFLRKNLNFTVFSRFSLWHGSPDSIPFVEVRMSVRMAE